MNDRDWLDKVFVAYKEYCRQFPNEEISASIFVKWLYQQYGVAFDDK